MRELNFMFGDNNVLFIVQAIRTFVIAIFMYYTNFKMINKKGEFNILNIVEVIGAAMISTFFRFRINSFIGLICLFFFISMIFSTYKVSNTITVTIISIAINYSIALMSVIFNYIFNKFIVIENDYINLILIILTHWLLWYKMIKMKRLKYGISFLKDNIQNDYMDILVLNICIMLILSIMLFTLNNVQLSIKIFPIVVVGMITLIITIRKVLQLYYKQKLLINDLNETKDELAARNKEIEKLEQENLNFSKISHSLAHKQKSLEHKIDELLLNSEIAGEIDVRDRLEEISKKLYKTPIVKLDKTGITQVDDMLNVMQSECIKNNIEFDLQIIGNVYHIINNIVTVDELEILIADHVKDAIIAINHTDNVNRSILVRLGKIDDCYGLYIHDSGIEFEKETLEKLGKEPITTHKSEGGTGMGFMNTFDTLKKCKGSLIINEIGKPSKDNFTKIVMIRFDGKNEFRVISYRENND